jgi:hypothetical protein
MLDRLVDPDALDGPEYGACRRILLGDLPGLLGSEGAEAPVALEALPERVERWRERLAALGPPPHVGVTWRAGTGRSAGPEFARPHAALAKEIAPAMLASVLAATGATVVILQRQPKPGEIAAFGASLGRPAHDLSALNDDLEDMLAVLQLLHDYAGVSNTNMHLLAGLGGHAKVLVPYPPEYRWMFAGEASPWFPGFRVYREAYGGRWAESLDSLGRDLSARHGPRTAKV